MIHVHSAAELIDVFSKINRSSVADKNMDAKGGDYLPRQSASTSIGSRFARSDVVEDETSVHRQRLLAAASGSDLFVSECPVRSRS